METATTREASTRKTGMLQKPDFSDITLFLFNRCPIRCRREG
jgi:hypothetical protein